MSNTSTSAFIADKEFRTKLKTERLKKNLSQKALAEKSGMSVSTVVRIESSEDPVNYTNILKYLDALDLQLTITEKPTYMVDE